MKLSFLFKINFAVLFVCFCESALSPEIKKVYHGLLSGKGLYVEEDGIVILNATNFKSTIYNTKNAWMVEFYNSWCGHCHKFAPVWKGLAASLYEWRNIVRLGAIDCSHDDHTSICRDFDIIAYPTVKFFSAESPASSLGTEILKTLKSEKEIIGDIIGILQKEQLEGRGSRWPNLIPYRSYDTANLRGTEEVQYVFLIFAYGNDSLATEVILDLSRVKEIEIRSVLPENEVLSKLLRVTTYPSLLAMEKSKREPQFLHPRENTRQAFRSTIKAFLRSRGVPLPEEPRTVKAVPPDQVPSLAELQQERNAVVQLSRIKELGDVVFLVDLENTLKYSLEHEVSSKQNISGKSFVALNAFLKILDKYFPAGKSGANFLRKLKETVSEERETTGKWFKKHLGNLSQGHLESVFLTREDWMGCRGSETYFRRYPCGVWTLFHYVTVNALRDSRRPQFDPLEVLRAMLGYVTYFFGCTECSKHFQQMVQDRGMRSRVKTAEDAVLWLWSAHNAVNKRLAGDRMEDPEFPKIQYPSPERCPDCRHSNGDWNEGNVLNYLISVYSQENLDRYGSDSNLHFPGNRSVGLEQSHQRKSELFEEDNPKKIGRDFNVFDISLCVVLYVASALICVGVCLKFVLKKRHKRKSHAQDLIGRV